MQARAVYAVKRGSSIKSRAMAELVLARTYWLVLPQIMSGRRPKTLVTSMGFEGGNWVAEGQKLDVSLFTCLNLRSQLCRLLLETSNWKKASWTRNQGKSLLLRALQLAPSDFGLADSFTLQTCVTFSSRRHADTGYKQCCPQKCIV